jgi:site-specific recombinase XerD
MGMTWPSSRLGCRACGSTGITPDGWRSRTSRPSSITFSGRNLTGVSRARKLAAIRKFFAFLYENEILQTNPAAAVKGARREEKEPAMQYKALLYEASESPRDYAIIVTFVQTGVRLSELAYLFPRNHRSTIVHNSGFQQ